MEFKNYHHAIQQSLKKALHLPENAYGEFTITLKFHEGELRLIQLEHGKSGLNIENLKSLT